MLVTSRDESCGKPAEIYYRLMQTELERDAGQDRYASERK